MVIFKSQTILWIFDRCFMIDEIFFIMVWNFPYCIWYASCEITICYCYPIQGSFSTYLTIFCRYLDLHGSVSPVPIGNMQSVYPVVDIKQFNQCRCLKWNRIIGLRILNKFNPNVFVVIQEYNNPIFCHYWNKAFWDSNMHCELYNLVILRNNCD